MKARLMRWLCGRRGHPTGSMVFYTADAHVVVEGCACGEVSKARSYMGQYPRQR